MFNVITESVVVAIILVLAMFLVAYLNKFQTNWINVCHTLGFSSKEKPSIVIAKIAELKMLEDESVVSDAKDALGL